MQVGLNHMRIKVFHCDGFTLVLISHPNEYSARYFDSDGPSTGTEAEEITSDKLSAGARAYFDDMTERF